ncbi:hypothetical protein AOLI_G00087910 [Acnodon oligacanthus]
MSCPRMGTMAISGSAACLSLSQYGSRQAPASRPFRWITKSANERARMRGARHSARVPTGHGNESEARTTKRARNELRDGQRSRALQDKSPHNDRLTGRRPLPRTHKAERSHASVTSPS